MSQGGSTKERPSPGGSARERPSPGGSTRERIVAAATELFAAQGYDGTTTAAIARRAGIAEGTIYRHFNSKKELFIACVKPVVEESFRRGLDGAQEGADLRRIIRTFLESRLQMFASHPDAFNILFTEAPFHPELAELLLEQVLFEQVAESGPALAQLLQSPELRRTPKILLLGFGVTVASWFIYQFRDRLGEMQRRLPAPARLETPFQSETLLDELTDFVLYGIAGEPAGGDEDEA